MPKYFFISHSDIVIFACIVGLAGLFSTHADAFKMTNSNYTILEGNLNSVAGKPTNSNYKLGITVGELGSGLYSGTNYKVRAGFQYIYSIIKFQFTISSTLIDFGTLTPTNPVTRTQTLTISNGSAHGYTVTASENHPLLVDSTGAVIPDTTCDSGTCTESTSSAWSNTLTYGFGYRCDNVSGTDCASGFTTSTFYKQFTNLAASETPTGVMTGANVGRNKQVQITYKANVSGTQPGGNYRNVITYIATPTL
jgi:hypothetical protein